VITLELAETFFHVYRGRFEATGRPQLLTSDRQKVIKRVVVELRLGRTDRQQAIARVPQEAFEDVVPRFHTLGRVPVTMCLYEATASRLVLTDDSFRVPSRP
jgi:hypothetical protein